MKFRSLSLVFLALVFLVATLGCAAQRKPEPTGGSESDVAWEKEIEERWKAAEARQKAAEEEAEKRAATMDVAKELLAWAKFYQDTLGTTVDFSKLQIPERKKGYCTLVVVAKGVTADFLIAKCHLRFQTWNYPENFNQLESVRDTNETYAVWLKWKEDLTRQYNHRGLSAEVGEAGATLTEQLLWELKFFRETRTIPFPTEVIVCRGSSSLRGDWPCVRWQEGYNYEFQVFMYGSMD